MATKTADVLLMSRGTGNQVVELIDAAEMSRRLGIPKSWIRNRTRSRTPKEERIPCVRLGRYVRYEWGSARLADWLGSQRE